MSAWLGYRNIDDLLTFAANTHSASTGAATDADAVPSYRVYEDESGSAILTGSMAKLDDTNTTGFYSEQISLTTANGFEAGKCYSIYISAAVSSVTGTTERHFSIWPAAINSTIGADVVKISGDSVAADNLESYTDGTTPMPVNATQISGDSTAADNLEAAADGTGYNLGNGQIVSASVTGAVGSVTGNVGGNVVGSVASVTGAVTVGTINSNVITASSLATDAVNEIADTVWDEPMSGHTSAGTYGGRIPRSDSSNVNVKLTGSAHIAADIHECQPDVFVDADFAAGSTYAKLATLIEADSPSGYRYTTQALEQAPSGGGGGGTTYVTGNLPYVVRADDQFPGGTVDIVVGTLMTLDIEVQDRDGNPINLTGGTVTVGVRNASTGATVGTDQSATLSLARLGMISVDTVAAWSATAGTYRITVSATLGSDVIVAGPLPMIVRSR